MTLSMPRYRSVTDLPNPTYLEDWRVSIVRPIARTNLVINPSFETANTGMTAVGGSIGRSTTESYHGAYSCAVTPTAGTTDGVYFGTVSLTSGTTYAASVKVKIPNAAGRKYRLAFATTGAVMLQTTEFVATGYWQWITCIYRETSTNTRRIYITKNGGTETAVYYVDGLQVEACETDNYFATTYIDGDQKGLLGDLESAPAYYWTGTPHASTSVRSGQTRAGGQVVKLQNYGFYLTAIIGLGMAPVVPITTSFGQLDGSQYLDQRNDSRSFVLNGRWQANTARQQDRQMAQLSADLNRDYIATRQPMTLLFEPMADGKPIRAPLAVPGVSYIGGLEGAVDGMPTADTPISFTQYLPIVAGGEDGIALDVQDTFTSAHIAIRSASGVWSSLSTGANAFVRAIAIGPDGTVYAGGNFTLMAGVANTAYIAKWDGSTWTALSTGANNTVTSLAFDSAGNLYAGGLFTLMAGVANTAYIAKWDGSTWTALGTGMNSDVQTIVNGPDGSIYAGGSFTLAGGVANTVRIAKWNGSAWSALGTGASTGTVYALAFDLAGNLYAGGTYALMGGVADTLRLAKWNGSAWSALGTGANGSVFALAIGPNNMLYLGGAFTAINSVTLNRVALWNGVQFAPLGSGMDSDVNALGIMPNGSIYAGGIFSTAGGVTSVGIAFWNGSAWTPTDLTLPGTVNTLAPNVSGAIYVGGSFSGSTPIAGSATPVNASSIAAYPRIVITNPTAANVVISGIYQITTSKSIYFNLSLLPSEVVALTLDPIRLALVSTIRGNLINKILPGSDVANFALQPGSNTITFFSASSSVTAIMSWPVTFDTLTDGWTK